MDWATDWENYGRADDFPEDTPVPNLEANHELLCVCERHALNAGARAWTAVLAPQRSGLFEPFDPDTVSGNLAQLVLLQAQATEQG